MTTKRRRDEKKLGEIVGDDYYQDKFDTILKNDNYKWAEWDKGVRVAIQNRHLESLERLLAAKPDWKRTINEPLDHAVYKADAETMIDLLNILNEDNKAPDISRKDIIKKAFQKVSKSIAYPQYVQKLVEGKQEQKNIVGEALAYFDDTTTTKKSGSNFIKRYIDQVVSSFRVRESKAIKRTKALIKWLDSLRYHKPSSAIAAKMLEKDDDLADWYMDEYNVKTPELVFEAAVEAGEKQRAFSAFDNGDFIPNNTTINNCVNNQWENLIEKIAERCSKQNEGTVVVEPLINLVNSHDSTYIYKIEKEKKKQYMGVLLIEVADLDKLNKRADELYSTAVDGKYDGIVNKLYDRGVSIPNDQVDDVCHSLKRAGCSTSTLTSIRAARQI